MVVLNLTPEQTELMLNTDERVLLRDASGNMIGTAKKISGHRECSPEEIEEYLRIANSPGPWYTYEEVKAKLAALEGKSQ